MHACMRALGTCMPVRVRACVRVCVRARVSVSVCMCVCVYVCVSVPKKSQRADPLPLFRPPKKVKKNIPNSSVFLARLSQLKLKKFQARPNSALGRRPKPEPLGRLKNELSLAV